CTLRDFHASTMKHKEQMNRFYLINLTDRAERTDQMLTEAIYANSLLYFVSGLLEEDEAQPLLGLQRHLEDELPAPEFKYTEAEQQVRDFIANNEKVEAYRSPSEFCEANTHGGFLDPPETANPDNGGPWLLKQTLHRFILGDEG
ncbi:MAG: hypothetical protein KDK23_15870, partial [Leptospiraceae bacterium]|nr:hypothetical protein [Leptospiraceae bacterium]